MELSFLFVPATVCAVLEFQTVFSLETESTSSTTLTTGVMVGVVMAVAVVVVACAHCVRRKNSEQKTFPNYLEVLEIGKSQFEQTKNPNSTDACWVEPRYDSLRREDEDTDDDCDYDYLLMMPEVIQALKEMLLAPKGQRPRKPQSTNDDDDDDDDEDDPELDYDYAYVHLQFNPKPIPLRKVEKYIGLMQEEISKYKDDFPNETDLLYFLLMDQMETEDTRVPSSEFPDAYLSLHRHVLEEQYQILELLTPHDERSGKTGLLLENIDKNRDIENVPNDRFRPILASVGEGRSDYINAVVISGFEDGSTFILTQSPMKNTVSDLWTLVNDWNPSTIVMLNQIEETTRFEDNLAVYWPVEVGSAIAFNELQIENKGHFEAEFNSNIYIKDLLLTRERDENQNIIRKEIRQLCLNAWNKSTLARDFINLIELITQWQSELPRKEWPVVIHCLNGVDRSGLFCGALYISQQIKLLHKVDVFSAVKHIRLRSPQCITSMEQYMCLYNFAMGYIAANTSSNIQKRRHRIKQNEARKTM